MLAVRKASHIPSGRQIGEIIGVTAEFTYREASPSRWWRLNPRRPPLVTMHKFSVDPIPLLDSIGAYGSVYTGRETEGTSISSGVSLNATQFAVPSGAAAVFEVAIELDCDEEGGDIEADFESGAFQIACPVVVIVLLNRPTGYPYPKP